MSTHHPPLEPLPLSPSQYGIGTEVRMRARDLPDIGSVLNVELFPERLFPVIFPGERGLNGIREATEASLQNVDMSMIKPNDSVNILASHHSFLLLGGEPYAEMVRTIKDVVQKRTEAKDIRFRGGVGLRFRESEEQIKKFGIDEYFDGKACGVAPIDRGIPIETSIGTLYGLNKVYDADWIIHTHNTDIREVHFHRMVDRIIKPFGMSYARIETRSTYHHNLGPRGANFVARAIFDSEMVQKKYAFTSILKAFPAGITGVDSDNDLHALNDRITVESLLEYGKVVTLLGKIPECIAILDCPGPVPYTFGGGLIFGNFLSASVDQFDLDSPLTPYCFYSEMAFGVDGERLYPDVPFLNPSVKMVINNYSFKGYPSNFFAEHLPTVMVGEKMAELYRNCPQNSEYMNYALTADNLRAAAQFAYHAAGTKNVIIFDGAREGINASNSLVGFLLDTAPQVAVEVERDLLPKWLRQRGLPLEMVDKIKYRAH
ncbi:MAG: hypothetical protein ABSG91_20710 [Syntrophobacteraceae bacterium]|jgi:hypothetical protein